MKKELLEQWSEVIDSAEMPSINSYTKKKIVAQLLENTERELRSQAQANQGVLSEANNVTAGVDNVDPILINLVRRVTPNLMAYDMVGVQPMTGPTGLVFAMRTIYGAQPAGPHGRPGDARTGFQTGDTNLSSGLTNAQENQVAGKATNEAGYDEARTAFSGAGTQSVNDGTVAYSAYDIGIGMSTGAGELLGESGGGTFGTMSFTIEKTSVEAKTRALKTEYTMELAQDLRAVHGLDAESELSNILSTEITAELNREMVNTIRKVAKIGSASVTYLNGSVIRDSNNAAVLGLTGEFDVDTMSNGRWDGERFASLVKKIHFEANAIAKDTRRGRGNFIIVSSNVASALGMTGKLLYTEAMKTNLMVDDTGQTFAGVLDGQFKVYIDPYVLYDEVIVGYKGQNQMDAGIFYCPYVPLQLVKAISPTTFQPSMAVKTRYGMKENPFTAPITQRNANSYFRKFKVSSL